MKSDEEIERERAGFAPTVGPTHADWYAEACKVGRGDPALLWACRCRELVRVMARDLGGLAQAAEKLLAACGHLEECGGQRVRDAMDEVEKAMWWRD